MPAFQDLRIRTKLLGALGAVALLTVVLSGVMYLAIRAHQAAEADVTHTLRVINQADQAYNALLMARSAYRGYLLSGGVETVQSYSASYQTAQQQLASLQTLTADNPTQVARWQRIEQRAEAWRTEVAEPGIALRQRVAAGEGTMDDIVAYANATQIRTPFTEIRQLFDDARGAEEQLLLDRQAREQHQNTVTLWVLAGGAAVTVVLGLLIVTALSNEIGGAMDRLTVAARQIADGDLGRRIGLQRKDEIGHTAAAFDQMAERVQSLVAELAATAQRATASETEIRTLLDSVTEGILTFGPDGQVRSFNPAAQRMFGYPDSTLTGAELETLVREPRYTGDRRGEAMPAAFWDDASCLNHRCEAVGHRHGGTAFPMEVVVTSMTIDDQLQYIAVARDISERHNAEQALQRQVRDAERARSIANAILDAAGEAMILISPDRQIVTINQRFSDFFAVEQDAVRGQPMLGFRAHLFRVFADAERFRELLYASLESSDQVAVDLFQQQWPARRDLHLFSTPVRGPSGEEYGRLFAFRDVTHEREVDRMKTEFVSLVSHELRTPLTSIKGYVDLLLEGEVGDLAEEQREFLEIVGSNAQRLVALINDLLDISRIEAGKIELSRTPVVLAPLIEGIARSFRPQIEAKQQQLTQEVAPDLPAVWADHDRLTQIITNLLSNAHKYTPAGGRIRIAAAQTGDMIRIDVQDSGIGLSEEEQSRLFSRFYRARNRTTQEVGGTGLGLTITRSLIEMHGGTITVESEPGQGATFGFTMPIATEQPALDAPALVAEVPASTEGGRILVVEDDPDIAQLIRRYLERAGYEVLIAGTATDALALAQRERPSLITLDVVLPDVDGLTVLEWLKANAATQAIPVLILSMFPDEGKGRRLGAEDFMTKPVDEEALLGRINRLLHHEASGTALVAEDDPDVRRLVVDQLRRMGWEVAEAADGEEAIARVRAGRFDVILMDVKMPRVDGIEALQAIRAMPAAQDCPIILMSGSPGVIESGPVFQAAFGVSQLLRKPFSPTDLARVIKGERHHAGERR